MADADGSGCPQCSSPWECCSQKYCFLNCLPGKDSDPLLPSSLFLQNGFGKKQVPSSLINTINNFSLYFKNSNRHFFFFKLVQNISFFTQRNAFICLTDTLAWHTVLLCPGTFAAD